MVFCFFGEKLPKHFQNTQASERIVYWFILKLSNLQYTDDTQGQENSGSAAFWWVTDDVMVYY